jgi:hypothetical protein
LEQNGKVGLEEPVVPAAKDPGLVSDATASKHLKRVLQSKTLRAAPTLRRLLEYMGTRTLDGLGADLKEYTIGVEALDRREDFDPKIDTSVRVQIHRLREKLSRYYLEEGRDDDVIISIPRGQYSIDFVPAEQAPVPPAFDATESAAFPLNEDLRLNGSASVPQRKIFSFVLIPILLVLGALAGFFMERQSSHGSSTASRDRDAAVTSLWAAFLGNDKEPIIGYTDATFLIDESNDLLRFRSGASSERGSSVEPHLAEQFASNADLVKRAGPLYYEDGYTGTGEVESAATLSSLFRDLGVRPQIKRARDITIDDLRNHNVVLLGSSFQNKTVDDLPRQGDFQFVKAGQRHELWDGAIANVKPKPGESPLYRTERDPKTGALRVDYALVSFQPGLAPDRHIVILGGLDTTGTLGATQFATSSQGAALLLKAGDSVQQANHKNEPMVQMIVRCVLKDGNSVYGVKALASHASEWTEKDQ